MALVWSLTALLASVPWCLTGESGFHAAAKLRRALVSAGVVAWLAAFASPDRAAATNAPLVALIAPHDGSTVNAVTLDVRALIAAFEPHDRKTVVFNGQLVAGRNAGKVSHIELAVDHVVVPLATTSRVEEALTPVPFACLVVDGHDDDREGLRRLEPLDLKGEIGLGLRSDGVDLGQDRVVIALGEHVTVPPAGAFSHTLDFVVGRIGLPGIECDLTR